MPVEIKGKNLRIRVRSPRGFTQFFSIDVGKKGRLFKLSGRNRTKIKVQSWIIKLNRFKTVTPILKIIDKLKIKKITKRLAVKRVKAFFMPRPTSRREGHSHKWSPSKSITSKVKGHVHRINLKKKMALPKKTANHAHRLL